jgi:hypothetical protein
MLVDMARAVLALLAFVTLPFIGILAAGVVMALLDRLSSLQASHRHQH